LRTLRQPNLPAQYGLIFGGQRDTIQDTNRELSTVIWLSVPGVCGPRRAVRAHPFPM